MWDSYYAAEEGQKGWFDRMIHWGREVYFSKLFAKRIAELGGPATSYLEVGVGSAQTIVRLQQMTGAKCTGIEKTPRAYELGKAHATACEIVLGDAMAMPFPDASFDVVYSLGLLEHFEPDEQARILREHARCARNAVVLELPPDTPHMRLILWVNSCFFGRTGVWADEELFSARHTREKYPGLPFRFRSDWPALGLGCWIVMKPEDILRHVPLI
ncbi:hypothetical protein A3E39_01160 [Candidatus Uhrbacteria bacterium RIFCSPHIGHO2_12_FULL_60_25]|uniref:Methyltransferase type 11 domain-containing protein n=1 Tax=Candidatus Uhrbacteria bacterium RIFCSPHIGHO2_12_FULL_60_25 TaxID=1802399 RepID=A0A1F7UKE2_9BACT|nr:MAG: hypothetical protein A3D73_02325 [Candidatus Uhrbacteria bacterium RIFCSPHIGHO2_02_FULL_60_44]OGL78753.1 MAG: hypothetical protein A3E39_01160 [Candidatus Uhrbacteria bacterium RIFCSPHIGHO2_12_FULL_60_25]